MLSRRIGAMAAVAVIVPGPLLAAQIALAEPITTTPVVPTPVVPTQTVEAPATVYAPSPQVPAPAYTPTVQAPAVITPPAKQPPVESSETARYTPPAERNVPTSEVSSEVSTPTSEYVSPSSQAVLTPQTTQPSQVTTAVTTAPTSAVTTSASSGVTTSEVPEPVTPGSAVSPPSDLQVPDGTPGLSASSSVTSTSVVPEPPKVEADAQAVQKAKAAQPVMVDPASPPPPPPDVKLVNNSNYTTQVNNVINNNVNLAVNINNTTIVNPRHWDYVDYDRFHHPYFYNPCDHEVWVRYWYAGAYQVVYVPVASRVVIVIDNPVVYPYTVLGSNFVSSGYFYGGGYVPPIYRAVNVYVPRYQQTVVVNKVTYVGHDGTRPRGQQDQFMLDDTTLAWGTKHSDQNIEIAKTQTTPGVGPTDDGASLVKLAAAEEPPDHTAWWLAGGGVALLSLAGVAAYVWKRPRPAHATDAPTQQWRQ